MAAVNVRRIGFWLGLAGFAATLRQQQALPAEAAST